MREILVRRTTSEAKSWSDLCDWVFLRAALPRRMSLLWFQKENFMDDSSKGDDLTVSLCSVGVEILFVWIIITQTRWSPVGFLPHTGLMENGFSLWKGVGNRAVSQSQIQADHFQDKYFLLNCFHFPGEVTLLPPWEASHAGNITPSCSALGILSGWPGTCPKPETWWEQIWLLPASPTKMWISAFWERVLWFPDGESAYGTDEAIVFIWGCSLTPNVRFKAENCGIFHFHQIYYKLP